MSLKSTKDLEKAFKQWGKSLYSYVYWRIKDVAAAEDIVQEAFMKAWKSRETFDSSKASLKTWLYTIVRNAMYDYFKSHKESEELDENIGDEGDIEEKIEKNLLVEKVYMQVELLAERDQELIILRYKLDLSLKEIAAILDIEVNAAKVAVHRAFYKLKELCEKLM